MLKALVVAGCTFTPCRAKLRPDEGRNGAGTDTRLAGGVSTTDLSSTLPARAKLTLSVGGIIGQLSGENQWN